MFYIIIHIICSEITKHSYLRYHQHCALTGQWMTLYCPVLLQTYIHIFTFIKFYRYIYIYINSGLALPAESWCTGSNAPSIRSLVSDEERMEPVDDFQWLTSVLRASFSYLTLFILWQLPRDLPQTFCSSTCAVRNYYHYHHFTAIIQDNLH